MKKVSLVVMPDPICPWSGVSIFMPGMSGSGCEGACVDVPDPDCENEQIAKQNSRDAKTMGLISPRNLRAGAAFEENNQDHRLTESQTPTFRKIVVDEAGVSGPQLNDDGEAGRGFLQKSRNFVTFRTEQPQIRC
ncbi:MAG TPA: hypothetical protein VII29_16550 [Terriglobales bacterium]